ncbi:uncharacterized protein KY384_007155 [Bacidia gigantensis]|uniref:uncharacterized protein n=1 Tax=Bacidia gigantensis TaxID=2732470 RepID=UPI001D048FAA|nr:uncharacterized protein KY384_007155 [Bacidia gigantensis]KAG8528238.1 hypothetical protein KY384_007155 [Bacidia gigantensis]
MGGGFKWKDKPTSTAQDDSAASKPKTLDRGYREAPPPRPASPVKDELASKFGDDYSTRYARKPAADDSPTTAPASNPEAAVKKEKKKKSGSAGPKPTSEPLIIVNVNDRLGTKAAIPCLASDPVRLFKAQVAARIGREPHEIKLQRQGERPFKDQLTLEDYGVSSGVQLDLEVDTGD